MSVVQFVRLDNILKSLDEGAINQTFSKMIDRLCKFRLDRGDAEIYRECFVCRTTTLNYRKNYPSPLRVFDYTMISSSYDKLLLFFFLHDIEKI